MMLEQKKQRKTILKRDWLRIHLDEVRLAHSGRRAERIVLEHPGAAGILAITDDDRVVLVEQYRYPTGETLYEIPAGKNDDWNADSAQTAIRELEEETPYTAKNWQFLKRFYVAPGYSDERIALYLATGLVQTSQRTPDEDECLQVKLFTKDEMLTMLRDGTICDAKTIIALQYWLFEHEQRI